MRHLGHGLGLRDAHLRVLEEDGPGRADWFEVETERLFESSSPQAQCAERLRRDRPLVLHGLGLGIANLDPLEEGYLAQLARAIERYQPEWISDHLAWCALDGVQSLDLLPFPFDEAHLEHVARRLDQVQTRLRRPLVLENISRYLRHPSSVRTEAQFLAELAARTGCGILLDLNNLVVNARNVEEDLEAALQAMPKGAVVQYHLAGHTPQEDYLLDTHLGPVPPAVWQCYRRALEVIGPRSTLIEWDFELPSYPSLLAEAEAARQIEASGSWIQSAPLLEPRAPDQATCAPPSPAPYRAIFDAAQQLERPAPSVELERYRRNHQALVLHTAWSEYPITLARLPEAEVPGLLQAYFSASPPVDSLPGHLLAGFAEYLGRSSAALGDLARFERALAEVRAGRDDERRVLDLGHAVHRLERPSDPLNPAPCRLAVQRQGSLLEVVEYEGVAS